MHTKGARGRGICQIEIEVEDVLTLDGKLLADDVQQQLSALQFVADNAQNGQHVFLFAQFHTVIHLAVEVDGQVADLQQRSAHMHEQRTRVKRISTANDDATCQRQRTVEPSRHDWTTIYLRVQLHNPPLAGHLGVGFDTERGRIAMGADHVKAHISQRLTPYLEGIDRRVVLRHKKFVTSRHLAQWLLRVNAAEARLFQFV